MKVRLPEELKSGASISDQELIEDATQSLIKFYGIADCKMSDFNFGQTKTLKKILKSDKGNFFIKVGEKVSEEKIAYQSAFIRSSKLFLQPSEIDQGAPRVLVLPFLESVTLEDFIFSNTTHWDVVFGYIDNLLEEIKGKFWLKNNKRSGTSIDQEITRYIDERVIVLRKTVFTSDAQNVDFNELSKLPIIYKTGKRVVRLPSIKEMTSEVIDNFKRLPVQLKGCVLGDFQPSNILIDRDKNFKIIDLSNFEESGDMALDLGKFFGYFSRFYLISLIRDKKKRPDFQAHTRIASNHLEISFDKPNDKVFINLANITEENFIRKLAIEINDYFLPDRVKLYKFVISLITMRRHLMKEELVDLLIVCLVDSYLEIKEKVIKI